MKPISHNDLNRQIIADFMQGKSIQQLALETGLDTSYITLVLYQEGVHYSSKEVFNTTKKNNPTLS